MQHTTLTPPLPESKDCQREESTLSITNAQLHGTSSEQHDCDVKSIQQCTAKNNDNESLQFLKCNPLSKLMLTAPSEVDEPMKQVQIVKEVVQLDECHKFLKFIMPRGNHYTYML